MSIDYYELSRNLREDDTVLKKMIKETEDRFVSIHDIMETSTELEKKEWSSRIGSSMNDIAEDGFNIRGKESNLDELFKVYQNDIKQIQTNYVFKDDNFDKIMKDKHPLLKIKRIMGKKQPYEILLAYIFILLEIRVVFVFHESLDEIKDFYKDAIEHKEESTENDDEATATAPLMEAEKENSNHRRYSADAASEVISSTEDMDNSSSNKVATYGLEKEMVDKLMPKEVQYVNYISHRDGDLMYVESLLRLIDSFDSMFIMATKMADIVDESTGFFSYYGAYNDDEIDSIYTHIKQLMILESNKLNIINAEFFSICRAYERMAFSNDFNAVVPESRISLILRTLKRVWYNIKDYGEEENAPLYRTDFYYIQSFAAFYYGFLKTMESYERQILDCMFDGKDIDILIRSRAFSDLFVLSKPIHVFRIRAIESYGGFYYDLDVSKYMMYNEGNGIKHVLNAEDLYQVTITDDGIELSQSLKDESSIDGEIDEDTYLEFFSQFISNVYMYMEEMFNMTGERIEEYYGCGVNDDSLQKSPYYRIILVAKCIYTYVDTFAYSYIEMKQSSPDFFDFDKVNLFLPVGYGLEITVDDDRVTGATRRVMATCSVNCEFVEDIYKYIYSKTTK